MRDAAEPTASTAPASPDEEPTPTARLMAESVEQTAPTQALGTTATVPNGQPDVSGSLAAQVAPTGILPTSSPTAPAGAGTLGLPPDAETLFGSVVAGWQLRELIGRGGFGAVYRTSLPEHPLPELTGLPRDRHYALKLCQPTPGRDVARAFQLELRALKAVTGGHDDIVKVHDYGFHGTLPYLVMDEQREDLARLLDRVGAVSAVRALELLTPIARALGRAHARGVHHRDVRPANILLGFDGRARLTDFGIAVLADEHARLTPLGQVMGVWAYVSPEYLATGRADADSDLWMLTCTLYRLLARQDAFPPAPRADRSWDSTSRGAIPAEIHPFFARAFAPAAAERYRNATEWLDALTAIVTPGQPRPAARTWTLSTRVTAPGRAATSRVPRQTTDLPAKSGVWARPLILVGSTIAFGVFLVLLLSL